ERTGEPSIGPRLNLRTAGQTATAHLSLAKSLYQKGRHAQALAELEAALGENPELAPAHFLKGTILALRADYAAAADCLEAAVSPAATGPGPWRALASARGELGEWERALSAADRAAALDGKQAQAQLMRGDLLAGLGRSGEAVAAYRRALELN